jgi:hypothetical protein
MRRDEETGARPPGERRGAKAVSRGKTLRNRADRRRQEQPLATLGREVGDELADEIESRVFHRKPSGVGPEKPPLGRETAARERRRRRLREITSRKGRGPLDPSELEEEG